MILLLHEALLSRYNSLGDSIVLLLLLDLLG